MLSHGASSSDRVSVTVEGFELDCPGTVSEGDDLECTLENTNDHAAEWPVVAILHDSSDADRALVRGSPTDVEWSAVDSPAEVEGGVTWIGDRLIGYSMVHWGEQAPAQGQAGSSRSATVKILEDDEFEESEVFYLSMAPAGTRGVGTLFDARQRVEVLNDDAKSDDARLARLDVSHSGSTTSLFGTPTDSGTHSVAVGYAVTSITVTAVPSDDRAHRITMTANDEEVELHSGEESPAVSLDTGTTTIVVEVVAQDESSDESYTINVTRAAATERVSVVSDPFRMDCPAEVHEGETAVCTLRNQSASPQAWPVVAILHSSMDGDDRALVSEDTLIPEESSSYSQDVALVGRQSPLPSNFNYGYGELFSGGSRTVRIVYGYEKFEWYGTAAPDETRPVKIWIEDDDLGGVDDDDEGDEVFYVALAQNAYTGLSELVDNTAPIIVSRGTPDVTVGFAQASYSVDEGDTVEVEVRLSEAPNRPVEVWLSIAGGHGADSDDYTVVPESLAFDDDDTSLTFVFSAADDHLDDDDETVIIGFRYLPDGVTEAELSQTTIGIVDQDDPGFKAVSAGDAYSCALAEDGVALCWGLNSKGRAEAPTDELIAIDAGKRHGCGLRADGTAVCWGDPLYSRLAAPPVSFQQISAGGLISCALTGAGEVYCWGFRLADPTEPRQGSYSAVTAGYLHACAIATDQTIDCWGDNANGQTEPPAGSYTQIAAGHRHTCAIDTGGSIQCWGKNTFGQADPPTGTFTHIDAGESHSCAIDTDQALHCWGRNGWGPTEPPPGRYTALALGNNHACAITVERTLTCWGLNDIGQSDPPSAPGSTRSDTGWVRAHS